MQKALASFRVLDLTNVLAGPFACHQLAHLGAEVIKVEVPGSGDLARQLGADAELNQQHMGISFLAQNSGKRSITVNLKHAQGKALLKKLVEGADVLVENFRPGVMKRLGLDYEELKSVNPSLIYCAISGYGAEGPMKHLPAYDQIIQGMSGVMSITGAPDNAPYRVGYPIADTIGGITAAFAISSALAGRSQSGKGSYIDVSMLESTLTTMGWVVSNLLIAGKMPEPLGNDNMTASPSGSFKTANGLINIAANKQEQFEAVCDVIGQPGLKRDARFSERQARLKNRQALTEILEACFAEHDAGYWEDKLNAVGVPAGRILTVPDALELEQVSLREFEGAFQDVEGVDREVKIVRPGFLVDGERPKVDKPPPSLGQHTTDILAELGYSEEQITELHRLGAI
ncbi:CaiB/BaiF CoA transferase family protein [Enterovibrio coralii]|uniref:CoA-transferase n=1 Tax=Enterovibrio coralii TaxID=294935 RepID=A0A135I634_9GAMM|nr:CaiB/BaiF CoA-transferase family protein [Enterovibrio coralii]KXF80916.1 CoA-transferase [Enterovibrio coralii]